MDSFVPTINARQIITNPKLDILQGSSMRLNQLPAIDGDDNKTSFSDVMTDMVKGLDKTAKEPDALLKESMVNPEVDVHDVMIAFNKAELTMNVATQAMTKFLQAYEKIISMQV